MRLMNKNQGSSLLEVLISVVILSIGLLGLAALQMASQKNNHSAQFRTDAVVQAYSLIDKMRLNKSESYELAMTSTVPAGPLRKDTDLSAWITQLKTLLPAAAGEVIVNATNGNIVSVAVRWDDSRGTSGSSVQSFSVSTEL